MVFAVTDGVWEWVSGGGVMGEFCCVVLVGLLMGRLSELCVHLRFCCGYLACVVLPLFVVRGVGEQCWRGGSVGGDALVYVCCDDMILLVTEGDNCITAFVFVFFTRVACDGLGGCDSV